ncbi:alpha/beta-hydrolase [Auriscalpium vulgare]|uniref:Alpha/beta-hydrolase n=1 Tax=Auriscalpium vulgare TaxID=40419 RepID=A0ACB8RKB4_9AGAM|nr:alpha/beta-hydrolase [Auriscalpium vulgare]
MLALIASFFLLSLSVYGLPAQDILNAPRPRPLVIWHGLGDSYASSGILEFQSMIQDIHPGIFIHSVYIDPDDKEDQRATFYGNVDEQVDLVALQLANVTELEGGFDAIGFSQGGQFLRAYVERYNTPPIYNLITFGSQHMGVADMAVCKPLDLLCRLARNAARAGVYRPWAQEHLVQAQYFRDPAQLPLYLESNRFLTSINNELPATRNATYARQLAALEHLVLVIFAKDKTVIPKESAWFGSYPPSEDGDDTDDEVIVPMRAQPLYQEDWIGLRELDERGRVVLTSCEGEHMQLPTECWKPLVERYVGLPQS